MANEPNNSLDPSSLVLKLDQETIYRKIFAHDVNGYKCADVDDFLDTIIMDYAIMHQLQGKCQATIQDLNKTIATLENAKIELQGKIAALSRSNEELLKSQATNVNLLFRINAIEKQLFGNKKTTPEN